MAETVAQFETPVRDREGLLYTSTVCGRERDDGLWEGWIEFTNIETRKVVRSTRETTQPNFTDLKYWATGLTEVYLEGALDRTLRAPRVRESEPVPPPVFDGPAERTPSRRTYPDAILDPFSVYEKSPELLVNELTALRARHLRQIITEYDLAEPSDVPLESLTEPELGSLIVRRVRELRA